MTGVGFIGLGNIGKPMARRLTATDAARPGSSGASGDVRVLTGRPYARGPGGRFARHARGGTGSGLRVMGRWPGLTTRGSWTEEKP